jgi:hypothetical protein
MAYWWRMSSRMMGDQGVQIGELRARFPKVANMAIVLHIHAPAPEHLTIASFDTVNLVHAELVISSVPNGVAIVPYRNGTSTFQPSVMAGEVIILTRELTALCFGLHRTGVGGTTARKQGQAQ